MSVVKGNDAGIRDDIGNLSAPWLLLPFFAGAAVERRDLAAAAGLAATVVALVAFYVANAFVLELGPHSLATDLRLTLGATGYWVPRGLVSGPVFGALGGLWRRRGYPALLGVAVLLLLDAEPLFWIAAHRMGGIASFAFQPSLAASAAEAAARRGRGGVRRVVPPPPPPAGDARGDRVAAQPSSRRSSRAITTRWIWFVPS